MVKSMLLVGIGGFGGSALRYLVQVISNRYFIHAPIGTFIVNCLGCLLIGLLYGLAEHKQLLSSELRLLLIAGFCGGFTTFSTFSIDNLTLYQERGVLFAGANIFFSVVFGLLFVYIGAKIASLIS